MDKINFVNGTTPAVNQTNLNQMQTNVETAINLVNAGVTVNSTNITTLNNTALIITEEVEIS